MIKQQQTTPQNRPEFGDMTQIKQRQAHLKPVNENTKPPKKVEHPCKFQIFIPGIDRLNRSKPCPYEELANGWCEEHQDAQIGMDLGAKIGYVSVEIKDAYTIIGQGEKNWLAYFEKARGKGLTTVLNYLQKRLEPVQ